MQQVCGICWNEDLQGSDSCAGSVWALGQIFPKKERHFVKIVEGLEAQGPRPQCPIVSASGGLKTAQETLA